MTTAQITFLLVILAVCCGGLAWLYLDARWKNPEPTPKMDDNTLMPEMLTKLDDQFSRSIYQKALDIGGHATGGMNSASNPDPSGD